MTDDEKPVPKRISHTCRRSDSRRLARACFTHPAAFFQRGIQVNRGRSESRSEPKDDSRQHGKQCRETENARIAQYAWDRLRYQVRGRIPPFRSSTDHTFVFRPAHLERLMREAGCTFVRTVSFADRPDHESVHWRLYKGLLRSIDRLTGGGEFVMAVGQRAKVGSCP